jgi:hypothetical protein
METLGYLLILDFILGTWVVFAVWKKPNDNLTPFLVSYIIYVIIGFIFLIPIIALITGSFSKKRK